MTERKYECFFSGHTYVRYGRGKVLCTRCKTIGQRCHCSGCKGKKFPSIGKLRTSTH